MAQKVKIRVTRTTKTMKKKNGNTKGTLVRRPKTVRTVKHRSSSNRRNNSRRR